MASAAISIWDGEWDVWADQWVDSDKANRVNVRVSTPASAGNAVSAIATAIRSAGPGGTLVFNVGHGYLPHCRSGQACVVNPFEGAVDIAPGSQMLLVGKNSTDPRAYAPVFYDVAEAYALGGSDQQRDIAKVDGCRTGRLKGQECKSAPQAQNRLDHWRVYQLIGNGIRTGRIYKVVFLTCRIGQASEFLRKIANDWHVIIEAYTRRVVLERSARPYRVHLEGDAATAAGAVNLPLATDANSIRVGPPY